MLRVGVGPLMLRCPGRRTTVPGALQILSNDTLDVGAGVAVYRTSFNALLNHV